MPVGRTTTRSEVRAIAMVAAALLVIVGGIALFLNVVASRGDVQIRLGDDYFNAGDAADIADDIRDRGPVLFSDLAGGSRDIVVNHLGDTADEGWVAFEARRAGDPRDCQVSWNAERSLFEYSCDDTVTFPPDGTGLEQLSVAVTDGRIVVDINAAQRGSTTVPETSGSTIVISGK